MEETTTTTTEEAQQTETNQEQGQEQQQQEQEQGPVSTLDDPMLSQLWDDLGIKTDNEPEGELEPEVKDEPKEVQSEEVAKEPEAQAEESKVETTEAEPEPKKEFSLKPKVDEETFRKVVREELEARGKTPSPQVEPAKPDEPEEDPYEQQLIGEQKEELELYRYAESKGEHKGKAKKLLSFYKDLDNYVEKSQREDPSRTFDDDDSEFMDYVRSNKPSIQPSERESLKRIKFKEEIVDSVKKEYEQTINGLKGELNEIRATPQMKATVKEAGRAFDEFSKLEEMKSEDPLKHKIFSEERSKYIEWADDFIKRWHGVKNVADDGYYNLINNIEAAADEFARSGPTDKNGQKFLAPSRYAQAQDKRGYWTWDQNDILEHFGSKSIENAQEISDQRIKELESYGFRRGVIESQSQKGAKEEPKPVNPPKASRATSLGAAEGVEPDVNHPGKDLIADLGINFGQ